MPISTIVRFAACVLCAVVLLAADPLSGPEADAITAAVQHKLAVKDFTTSMFEEKPYAVAFWDADSGYAAGEALLKKTKDDWVVIKMTTGSLKDAALLESLGVPAATAQAFVHDLTIAHAR